VISGKLYDFYHVTEKKNSFQSAQKFQARFFSWEATDLKVLPVKSNAIIEWG